MAEKKQLKVGDEVGVFGNRRIGEISGVISSMGRTNVKVSTSVRFAPDGPWHDQVHVVPIYAINVVMRDGKIILDERGKK
jgi:hypothetical protein